MDTSELLMEIIRARRSIRKFEDRQVPAEMIEDVLDAARWAPSNLNRQGWRFTVVTDRQLLASLADSVAAEVSARAARTSELLSSEATALEERLTVFRDAPVTIVVLSRMPTAISLSFLDGVEDAELVSGEFLSAAMATQNLLLSAHAVGLGACVMTGPLVARETIEKGIGVPPGHKAVCLVALGFPAERPDPPPRKPLAQIVEFRGDMP